MMQPDARAERTEPATGEDVDHTDVMDRVLDAKRRLFARIIANAHRLDTPFTDEPRLAPWDLLKRDMERLEVAVAALDLPALRAALGEAQAEIEALKNARLLSVIFGAPKDAPQPFALYRRSDVTGVSGTGVVAEGVAFSDGTACLRWLSEWPTSVVFHDRGVEAIEQIHGHGGATQIVWLSEDLGTLSEMEQERDQARDDLARARADVAEVDRAHIELDCHAAMEGCDECPESAEPCPAVARWVATLEAARQHGAGGGGEPT